MSLTYPTTKDTPVQFALMPDWAAGVKQQTIYRTDITRSRRGLEQRSQRQRKPSLMIEYQADHIDEDARRLLERTVTSTRGALLVPWWPNGSTLQSDMGSATGAVLDSTPISDDWDLTGWVYLWHRTSGAEWRELASRSGRNLTLTDSGGHTLFPAGSHCFPVRLAVRMRDDNLLESPRHQAETNRLIFRTL